MSENKHDNGECMTCFGGSDDRRSAEATAKTSEGSCAAGSSASAALYGNSTPGGGSEEPGIISAWLRRRADSRYGDANALNCAAANALRTAADQIDAGNYPRQRSSEATDEEQPVRIDMNECKFMPECWGWPECGHEPPPERVSAEAIPVVQTFAPKELMALMVAAVTWSAEARRYKQDYPESLCTRKLPELLEAAHAYAEVAQDPDDPRRERATPGEAEIRAAVFADTVEMCAQTCDDQAEQEGARDPQFYRAEVGAVKRASARIRRLASPSSGAEPAHEDKENGR